MTTNEIQIWVGIIGSLVTVSASVLGVLNFQRRRDRDAAAGAAFKDIVTSLASDNLTLQMASAILLRRFFDSDSEQGAGHLPYANEAAAVIAGLLREAKTGPVQKVLADGLRYAPTLAEADLQGCNLTGAYLGQRRGDTTIPNLANADLFGADLTEASLRGANAAGAVFRGAILVRTVLSGANLTGADFRAAKIDGARFDGAQMSGAQFSRPPAIPADIASQVNAQGGILEGESTP
jgi:uncharacterized protein YjbI with pentapeptide repeats